MSLQTGLEMGPTAIAARWLAAFDAAVGVGDSSALLALFVDDPWWRDILAVTWDLRTMHGPEAIVDVVGDRLASTGFHDLQIDPRVPIGIINGVLTAAFSFRTNIGEGRGYIRLREVRGEWRAWTLLTMLDDLNDFPERRTVFADARKEPALTADGKRESWYEYRERLSEFRDSDPDVLVIGAGHAGLSSAARLQHLGLSTLIVEQTPRVGDVWRQRYRNLILHTVHFFVQMPYLAYPDNWPIFPSKDLIADWLEAYAWMLQLNVWTSAQVVKAEYDEVEGRWTVSVQRGSETRTVRPQHVVFASGAHSGFPQPPRLPGIDDFAGFVAHSSALRGADPKMAGKRVIVVGAGSSGIDLAEDAYEMGADVTIVQRNGTTVMSFEYGMGTGENYPYSEFGPALEDADLQMLSLPHNLLIRELAPMGADQRARLEAPLHDGLRKVGFEVSPGPYGSGHVGQTLMGGGAYIDTGGESGLKLIIAGKIAVQRGQVASFTEHGVVFSDGSSADADYVLFATGFPNMRDTIRPIVGDDVADSVTVVWGLDEEGEINGLYRPSGHPRLWFMGGGFQDSRWGSKFLALQIKASVEDLIR